MIKEILHRHHIIPKHMGGTDDEENLTPPISIEVHAAFHKDLWDFYGKIEDFIAWKALSGRMTSEEARLAAALEGQKRSQKYQNRSLSSHLSAVRTKETCSKGGKIASKKLVQWQRENKEQFHAQCAILGKETAEKLKIKHEYLGGVYESKKQLQEKHKMWNNKFYKLLASGDIKRL